MHNNHIQTLKPVIIIGAGGHGCTIVDYLLLMGKEILGFTERIKSNFVYRNIRIIGNDNDVLSYNNNDIELALGIGIIPKDLNRENKIMWFQNKGYSIIKVVSTNSFISPSAILNDGVQISAGAIIQSNVKIGDFSIINTCARVDHNSIVGNHCHVAPGVTICGNVIINNNVFIGAGSTIIQGINIGENSFIAAGSTIVKDVKPNTNIKFKSEIL